MSDVQYLSFSGYYGWAETPDLIVARGETGILSYIRRKVDLTAKEIVKIEKPSMKMNHLIFFLRAFGLTLVILGSLMILGGLLRAAGVSAQGLGNCDTGWVEKDESAPFEFSGNPTHLIVKAGSQNQGQACFQFTYNGTDGCYQVSGFDTPLVTVTKIGSGRECKDISHVEWYATQTPTPSPSTEMSPSPTASASATPSATPSPIATPSPTPLTSPSPTSTNSDPAKEQAKIMEEVKRENGGVMPQIGFK